MTVFFVKGGLAFGPVYFGTQLAAGVKNKKKRQNHQYLEQVAFGPPIIQAFNSEKNAAPFGVAIHESARAFAPRDSSPFQINQWQWWQYMREAPLHKNLPALKDLKDCLLRELRTHFDWMKSSLIFHGLEEQKISSWRALCEQYFLAGANSESSK